MKAVVSRRSSVFRKNTWGQPPRLSSRAKPGRLAGSQLSVIGRLSSVGRCQPRPTGLRLKEDALRAKSQKPEARSQKPEARSQKPEARSQKPEAIPAPAALLALPTKDDARRR